MLVEGDVDKRYFEFFRDYYPKIYTIPKIVEIESYGGAGALSNVAMLRFVKRKFKKMFVTFDLDCEATVTKSLTTIGMKVKEDFCSIGKNSEGAQCIEGLLPASVISKVYGEEIQLVQETQSAKSEVRKSAKNRLKAKLLETLIDMKPDECELLEFKKLFSLIAKAVK